MTAKVDICVIGGSAGSLTALKQILPTLPPDLPMTLLLCQHVSAASQTLPVNLLQPHSSLPVRMASDGMPLVHGEVIVAPDDVHMMLGRDHIHLRRGAQENNFRPAIDPLFRSAAVYRSTRAVGLILSGMMDDGAAGARAMVRTGGTVLVQAPTTAEFPGLPNAVSTVVPEARLVALERIGSAIVELAGAPADTQPRIPWDIGVELKIAALEGATMSNEARLGELSPFNCPHCNGVLWEIEDGSMIRYRCHTGHAYTLQTLSAEQDEMLDRSLFESLRAHRGRAAVLRKMSKAAGPTGRDVLERRAGRVEEDAQRLESIIAGRYAADGRDTGLN